MLRLTGGQFRGRSILTPKAVGGVDKTRPTQAKLRQALFNSLQTRIPGARVLDLFAGSGALGFEALSRGAEEVTFVESSRAALKLLSDNARTLGVSDQVRVISETLNADSMRLPPELRSRLEEGKAFDIVLADPPYAEGWEMPLLFRLPWRELLIEGGVFCLEWGQQKSRFEELPEEVPFLAKIREKNYGDSALSTYERVASETRPIPEDEPESEPGNE